MKIRTYTALCISLLLICFSPPLHAQSWTVSGKVMDSVTRKPLAFVALTVNNSRTGGTTDIDGNFRIHSAEKPLKLIVSYVGYISKTIFPGNKLQHIEILISPARNLLSEVVIVPGENPAHRIIRRALENRKQNDPEQMQSFRYRSYNKITAEFYLNEDYYAAAEKWKNDSSRADSTAIRLGKMAGEQYILMMESFTECIFLYPNRSRETVLGTKISGFKDPNFASLATDIQPFSFSRDLISLKLTDVQDYLNPVGNGSIGRYSYLIEDTLYDGNDSIYVISFRPMKGKTFNALQGVVYINTNGYAIQNIIAEPASEGLWKIRIQQQYRFVDGKHWFPEQLNYDWILPKYPTDKVGVMLKGRSYIDSVELEPEISPREFGPDKVEMTDSAGRRNAHFWLATRPDTLNPKEVRTYKVMDSLGRKFNLDYYTRLAPAMMDGYFPIGPLELSYDKLFDYNRAEGYRLGLGMRTGRKISRHFVLGGYFGYGFGDKLWKYGSEAEIRLWRRHDLSLVLNYQHELEEPGNPRFYKFRNSSYWQGLLSFRQDLQDHASAAIQFRTFRYLEAEMSAHVIAFYPQYPYQFTSAEGAADSSFITTEGRLALRYAFGEEITQAFGERLATGTRFPVIYFTFSQGLSGILPGTYTYQRIELALQKDFRVRNLGTTSLLGEAGLINGLVPYPLLFRARGSFYGDLPLLIHNTFQTMRVDEFAADRYAALFFRHNFGSLLLKSGKFKPEISIANNIYFSWLDNPEKHGGTDIRPAQNGYYEGGLIIDNLIKIKLMNIAYLGLGGGVFYRYGPYTFIKAYKNFAYKISFRITGS